MTVYLGADNPSGLSERYRAGKQAVSEWGWRNRQVGPRRIQTNKSNLYQESMAGRVRVSDERSPFAATNDSYKSRFLEQQTSLLQAAASRNERSNARTILKH